MILFVNYEADFFLRFQNQKNQLECMSLSTPIRSNKL